MLLTDLKFVTEPDETGLGRIIVSGRYYGLPVEAVREIEKMCHQIAAWEDDALEARWRD